MEDVIYSKYSWLHGGALCDFHRLRCQTESPVTDSWRVQIIPCLNQWLVGDPALHACGVAILENWLQIFSFSFGGGESPHDPGWIEPQKAKSSAPIIFIYQAIWSLQQLCSHSAPNQRIILLLQNRLLSRIFHRHKLFLSCCTSYCIPLCLNLTLLPSHYTLNISTPSTCLSISFLLFSSSSCSPVCLRGSVPVQVGIRETQRK